MNKRGQFFLIAALVIIGVMVGLVAVYTTAQTPPEDSTVYDLSSEMGFEAGQVIDQGVFQPGITQEEMRQNVENLTDYYASANLGTDFIVVYGDRNNMSVISYSNDDVGSIGLSSGSTDVNFNNNAPKINKGSFQPDPSDKNITILINQEIDNQEIEHTFDIKPGQTFFVILKKESQGERYVSASNPDIN